MLEREAQLAEERKKAEELARVQAQQATLNKAATMLQKMWRGRIARRELRKHTSWIEHPTDWFCPRPFRNGFA